MEKIITGKETALKLGIDVIDSFIDIKPLIQTIFGMEVWIDSSLKGKEFYILYSWEDLVDKQKEE